MNPTIKLTLYDMRDGPVWIVSFLLFYSLSVRSQYLSSVGSRGISILFKFRSSF